MFSLYCCLDQVPLPCPHGSPIFLIALTSTCLPLFSWLLGLGLIDIFKSQGSHCAWHEIFINSLLLGDTSRTFSPLFPQSMVSLQLPRLRPLQCVLMVQVVPSTHAGCRMQEMVTDLLSVILPAQSYALYHFY